MNYCEVRVYDKILECVVAIETLIPLTPPEAIAYKVQKDMSEYDVEKYYYSVEQHFTDDALLISGMKTKFNLD